MSRQKAGLRKEHELAKEIYDATAGSVIPLRAGWSGNQAVPSPDLLIPYKGALRAVEVKTSGQDRMYVSQDDVSDILYWTMNMNETMVFPYLSVKFTYYEMYTGRLKYPWDVEASFEEWAEECPFDAHVTSAGNLSIGHPTKHGGSAVSSQKSPGDGVALIRDIGSDYHSSTQTKPEVIGVAEVLKQFPEFQFSRK